MLDILKLKAVQVTSGYSVSEIAKQIGIHEVTLYRKMKGEHEFTESEMLKIKNMLNMDCHLFCNIFFANQLTQTQRAKQS